MPEIVPAILTNNLEDYSEKISILERIVSRVQVDVIDGIFVPNHTVSLNELATVRTSLFLELHLMAKNPEKYLDKIAKIGVKLLVLHFEACEGTLEDLIEKVHSMNIQIGIAINPETSIEKIKHILDAVDLVLIMGVHPGFEGQKFIPETLEKIKALRKISSTIPIEMDGGINKENIKKINQAGADYLVIGSSLFKNGVNKASVIKTINELNKEIIEQK